MAIEYEWDIEECESGEDGDILEHNHFDKCPVHAGVNGDTLRLVLVKNVINAHTDLEARAWAYAEWTGQQWILPEFFSEAYGKPFGKVPQRFHKELAKAQS